MFWNRIRHIIGMADEKVLLLSVFKSPFFWWCFFMRNHDEVNGGGYVELTKVIYLLGFIFVLLLFRWYEPVMALFLNELKTAAGVNFNVQKHNHRRDMPLACWWCAEIVAGVAVETCQRHVPTFFSIYLGMILPGASKCFLVIWRRFSLWWWLPLFALRLLRRATPPIR